MTRILVTGGKGVLGSALIPQLLKAGYQVSATSRRPPKVKASLVDWRRLDLTTDSDLSNVVAGIDTIVHAASNGAMRTHTIDVTGTHRLLDYAEKAGVQHFLYISIVGIDRIPFAYYKHKLAAEQHVKMAKLPWSILRITQFHSLIDMFVKPLTRLPMALLPTDFKFQTIAPVEAARSVLEAVQAGPGEMFPDVGGPEVFTLGDMLRPWLAARGERRWVARLPIPGQVGDGFRQGFNTVPGNRYGKITWQEWLAEQYPPAAQLAQA